MFGLFNKSNSNNDDDGFDPDKVKVHYEGGVMSPEYAVNSLNKENINDQDYPYHNLFPDGHGKIVYSLDGEVIEQYEGMFEAGQYHGKGILIDRFGEIYEGEFKENSWVKVSSNE